jgi:putative ATP-binding cassette transporter
MQTASAFGEVQSSLSWFIESYAQLAAWKATLDRLTGFRDAIAKAKAATRTEHTFDRKPDPRGLVLEGVDVRLPNGQALIENVNLTVEQGDAVLVRGASGSGKTTLFRVLAGLWPFGRGRVALPDGARIFFLPQKPYLSLGTLREVLTYPEAPGHYTEAQVPRGAGGVWLAASGGAPR